MDEFFYNFVTHQIGGYKFKNHRLMKQAFVRKSYTEENGGENNEVLEYIGDKAIDLAVIRYQSEKYGNIHPAKKNIPVELMPKNDGEFHSQLNEGELTKMKQRMVEKMTLARRIDELELAQFMIMGKGDIEKGVVEELSVKEDLFEAIVGAVALDSGWNLDDIQNVVEIMLNPDSFMGDEEEADYVGLIYEWEHSKNGCNPYFKYKNSGPSYYFHEDGVKCMPVKSHLDYNFTCQLKMLDILPIFEGYGKSKNEARKAVCKYAYEYLHKKGMLPTIKDEIDNPNETDAIAQLEILARRGYFDIPIYEYEEKHDSNGNPVWLVTCRIEGYTYYFGQQASSKKHAKKLAAYKMLTYILDHYEENRQNDTTSLSHADLGIFPMVPRM